MSSALTLNQNRPQGPTYSIKFQNRPVCQFCEKPLVIRDSSKPKIIIDLHENISIIHYYYQCNKIGCKGKKLAYISPENTYAPLKADYSYTVYAKICQLRWQKHMTYDEICSNMDLDYRISLSRTTVETALKIYEIGTSLKYLPEYCKKIQINGGIIITIDGMAPLKGNNSLYVAYDYYTGLTLGAKRLPNQNVETIEEFLKEIKLKIDTQLCVPIVGIISDALVSQRIAIDNVFNGIPHCLCHYHFFKLILVNAMNQDSQIMTELRKKLRKHSDIHDYKVNPHKYDKKKPLDALLICILDALVALSNWKRHPKDPCFSGLILYQRISDILEQLTIIIDSLKSILGDYNNEKVFLRLYALISEMLETVSPIAKELNNIQKHLEILSDILGNLDSSFKVGLCHLRKFRDRLRKQRFSKTCGSIEKDFIEELMKYVRTKGAMLFNYKKVSGAPTTNNSHELKFKQLKHFLRRAIGFASAKKYLLSHGERIVFINKDESLQSISLILQNTDFKQAREIIENERIPRNGLPYVMHYQPKWDKKIQEIKNILYKLQDPLCVIN